MPADLQKARELFLHAVGKLPPEQWDGYVAEACGGDAELEQQVGHLLQVHREAGSFLDRPAVAVGATGAFTPMPGEEAATVLPRECAGTVIGPYKLLQQIGEGGMGTVFMAEQAHPVQRKVALKVIKPGMDSQQVIARFEAERQALAMMDHVNIARVLDAGATESGLPYFVMELVHGVPITKYCDDNHLTPRERLELFVPVCQAIQHAHQKGIIHRDVKPSNVMITLYDGKPVPKVIDFGVAKATEQKLTERTLFTQYGTMVGTLEYMSPEQAEMSALGVDTRSDIYSLGVLLYELLTGNTPLTHKRMKEAAYAEILRMIKEEEPPKPSTRLSDSGEALASISANRHTEPAKLTKLVRGELDWIVMKTLEKDRNRRYETAKDFAADVQRYLDDEQVQACPPSAWYRFRKFARRNKAALVMASVIGVALLLAVGSLGWTVRDRAARQGRIGAQVDLILGEVDQLEKEQKWPEALVAARRAASIVAGGEADADTTIRVRERLKDLELTDRLEQIRMQRAMWAKGLKFDFAREDREYAGAFRDYGVDVDALAVETSIDRLKTRPAFAIPLAATLDDWVSARRMSQDKSSVDVADWKRLVAVARGIDPEPVRNRIRATWGQPLADAEAERRRLDEAEGELRRLAESIDIAAQHPATLHLLARPKKREGGVRHSDFAVRLLRDAQFVYPGDFWLNWELGAALSKQKDHEGAIRFYTAAVAIRPNSAATHNNLGLALYGQKKLDEAIRHYRKAIQIDAKFAVPHNNLGIALRGQRKWDEAIACYMKAIELDPQFAIAHNNLGIVLSLQGKLDEAIACYMKAIELDPQFANAHLGLGDALRSQGNAQHDRKKLDEAIDAYRKAIELDPIYAKSYTGLAWDYYNLGLVLHGQKKLDEAIAAYRKAIEIDPKYVNAYHNLGIALHKDKKLDEAIDAFRKAIEVNPKYAAAHSSLGALLCDHLKDYDKAIECFRKAIEIEPKSADANRNLGVALSKKGWNLSNSPDPKLRDPKRAVELGKEAVEIAPHLPQGLQWLGWIQYRTGNWKASIEALEKSCKLQPGGTGDAGQWIVLALAHAKLAAQEGLPEKEREHHRTEARRWFDQADKQIDKWWRVRPADVMGQAIWDFRAEARELMGTNDSKK